MDYEQYEHWPGKDFVWVRSDLRGRHREHCLCHSCKKLDVTDRKKNCPRANELFAYCVKWDMTTPVWECPEFEPLDNTPQKER